MSDYTIEDGYRQSALRIAGILDEYILEGMSGLDLTAILVSGDVTYESAVKAVEGRLLEGESLEEVFEKLLLAGSTPKNEPYFNYAGFHTILEAANEQQEYAFMKEALLMGESSRVNGTAILDQLFGDLIDPKAGDADSDVDARALPASAVQAAANFGAITNAANAIHGQFTDTHMAVGHFEQSRQSVVFQSIVEENNATALLAGELVTQACQGGQSILNAEINARTTKAETEVNLMAQNFKSARDAMLQPLLDLDDTMGDVNDPSAQWIDGLKELKTDFENKAAGRVIESKLRIDEAKKAAKAVIDNKFDVVYVRPDGTRESYLDVGMDGANDEGGSLHKLRSDIISDFTIVREVASGSKSGDDVPSVSAPSESAAVATEVPSVDTEAPTEPPTE